MARLKDILRRPAVQNLFCALTAAYIRFAHATSRWDVVGAEAAERHWDDGTPFILAFWHGRLLMMPYCWRRGAPLKTLISHHADGRLIAETIRRFGLDSIAGSTSRGGGTAFRALMRELREGRCAGFTPDGPRGPRMRASLGTVQAAKLSGAPIIPCTYAVSRRIVLNSWDRFVLALPFSRGVIMWGAPIMVPRDADDAALERARQRLEDEMIALCRRADATCGVSPIEPAALGATNKRDAEGARA